MDYVADLFDKHLGKVSLKNIASFTGYKIMKFKE